MLLTLANHFGAAIYGKNSPDLKYLEADIERIAAMSGHVVNSLVGGGWDHDKINDAYLPFVQFATRVKDGSFKEETEVRFVHLVPRGPVPDGKKPKKKIHFRERNGEQIPYVVLFEEPELKLPIRRIIVGPHPLAP